MPLLLLDLLPVVSVIGLRPLTASATQALLAGSLRASARYALSLKQSVTDGALSTRASIKVICDAPAQDCAKTERLIHEAERTAEVNNLQERA